MKSNTFLSLFLIVISGQFFPGCIEGEYGKHNAANLRCEYMINPMGLDTHSPRFTWQLVDHTTGAKQTAYQIIAGKDSARVSWGKGDLWDSGKISSGKMLVSYEGAELEPLSRYFWTVRIWNGNSVPGEFHGVASFETGMMGFERWQGKWISDSQEINIKSAAYFRKEFQAKDDIVSARAYIAVAGLYELHINGENVGDERLKPAFTRYDKRVLYHTIDVTKFLNTNENVIGVLLGNGWYNHQSTAVWDFHKAPWRARPKFKMELHLNYEDGSAEVIPTSVKWKTSFGPITFNSIYTGEHMDHRLLQNAWDSPGFDDTEWKDAIMVEPPTINVVAEVMPPIRNVEAIPARKISKLNEKTFVFDFGRIISGVSEIKVKGEQGTVIHLKHGEQLAENGHVDLTALEVHYRPVDDTDPFQTDIFILSGEGEESFMPSFNYKGFQYVEVTSSKPISLTKESLTAYFMHSDVEQVGYIESSDTLINKIWQAANSSYLSNLFGYPTDCPQREKNGWTGDAHTAIELGLFNFNGIKIYEKWMADHRDEQRDNGVLPAIIPTAGWGYHWANGPDWTSTIALIPWNIYLFYGDTRILEENYENIKLYVDHLQEISPDYLTDWGLGDWVPIQSKSDVELTSSIFYYTDALILSKIARILNKNDDSEVYLALASKIKDAINNKFLDKEKAIYASGFQTELSVPLYWGVVPENMKAKVAASLAQTIEDNGTQLDVGILGSKAILNALSENGYANLAYQLASNKKYPSWGWWIANGATTLFENWDINANRDLSLNHIMFGEISAWYFKALGGINIDESTPGFKNILLKPNFVTGLEEFKASHKGPYGEITSEWVRVDNNILYSVRIPPNSSATLMVNADEISGLEYLNDAGADQVDFTKIELVAGSHEFIIHIKTAE